MEGGKKEGRRKGKKGGNGGRGMASICSQFGKSFCVFTSLMHLSFLIFSSYFYLVLQQFSPSTFSSEQTNSFRYR